MNITYNCFKFSRRNFIILPFQYLWWASAFVKSFWRWGWRYCGINIGYKIRKNL